MKLDSKKQKLFFVSDLHYAHNKPFILTPRCYNNIQEAMEHTWQTLIETVGINDIIFNLGDLIVGAGINATEYTNKLIRLPCAAHYFINGNHSAGIKDVYKSVKRQIYPNIPDEVEVYPLTVPGTVFTFLGHRAEIFIDGIPVILDHYPIASWNYLSKNAIHIHGHCHCNLKDGGTLRRIDVGWDYKRRPVEWNEILLEVGNREIVASDHHGKE